MQIRVAPRSPPFEQFGKCPVDAGEQARHGRIAGMKDRKSVV